MKPLHTPLPSPIVTAESLRSRENWIPAVVLATHPRLAAWSEDKTPAQIKGVVDGISKELHGTRYDNLSAHENARKSRGKVWDRIESILKEGGTLETHAVGSSVAVVKQRVRDYASLHCLPDPHTMNQVNRDIFADNLAGRRESLRHGRIFGFEQGMSTRADSESLAR